MLRDLLRSPWIVPPLMLLPGGSRHLAPAAGGGRSRAATADEGFATFFETSNDPLVVIDSALRVAEANAAAARFLRVPREKLKGAAVLEVDLLARLLTAASIPQRLRTERSPIV